MVLLLGLWPALSYATTNPHVALTLDATTYGVGSSITGTAKAYDSSNTEQPGTAIHISAR
jgi:hypothetical protein